VEEKPAKKKPRKTKDAEAKPEEPKPARKPSLLDLDPNAPVPLR
jgi:hypothetical protein